MGEISRKSFSRFMAASPQTFSVVHRAVSPGYALQTVTHWIFLFFFSGTLLGLYHESSAKGRLLNKSDNSPVFMKLIF